MTPRELFACLRFARARQRGDFYLAVIAAQGDEKRINEVLRKMDSGPSGAATVEGDDITPETMRRRGEHVTVEPAGKP